MWTRMISGIGVAAAVAMLAAGCATTPVAVPKPVGLAPKPVVVRLEVPPPPAALTPVQDRADINEVVRFGLALSDAGQHAEAAQVFLKASGEFRSRGKMLEQDLVKAAIAEHWLAGDVDAVRKDFRILEQHRQDLYDACNEDATIRRIREIVSEKN